MNRWYVIACMLWLYAACFSALAESRAATRQMLDERVHFLKCLASVYDPKMWLSYNGSLYFYPRTESDLENLQAMKEARDNYMVLTNRLARYAIATAAVARSGVGGEWQKKLLLPYSNTNVDLTPTRDLKVTVVPKYEVLTNFSGGDTLITTETEVFFVMEYGRAIADAYMTNAVLVREGTKSFKTPNGDYVHAEAFMNAGLSREEIGILQKVSKACLTEALFPTPTNAMPAVVAEVTKPVNPPRPKPPVRKREVNLAEDEFQRHLMMAKDSSPYIQFLLGKDYFEGLGTAKDEKLGMEWMERAAKNGSGDAKVYLERLKTAPR